MEFLNRIIAAALPLVHASVARLGPIPTIVLVAATLLAIWIAGRLLSHVMILVPGVIAGALTGWWVYHTQHRHPLLAILAGLAVSGVLYRIFAGFWFLRLAAAIVVAPIALWIVWHLAFGVFDTLWATGITVATAATLWPLLRIFVNSEDHALRSWAVEMIELIRGD